MPNFKQNRPKPSTDLKGPRPAHGADPKGDKKGPQPTVTPTHGHFGMTILGGTPDAQKQLAAELTQLFSHPKSPIRLSRTTIIPPPSTTL